MKGKGINLSTVFGKDGTILFLRAVKLFNEREFWKSHEVFEDLWRSKDGGPKKFAQALVQAAAAFSYIKLKRFQSTLYLFDKSIEKFETTQHLPGFNVGSFIAALRQAKSEVERLGESGLQNFDESLYPRLTVLKARLRRKTTMRTKRTKVR